MKFKIIPIAFWSLLACVAIPTISCESESASDVNQDRIFTTYSIGYDARTGETEATATFFFGGVTGTVLELDPPSEVTINDLEMEKRTGILVFYSRDFPELVDEGTFRFTDADATTYTNTIPIAESVDFNIPSNTISKSEDYVLTWIGEPIQQFETISVSISTNAEGTSFFIVSESGVGATTITLPASSLSALTNGQHTIDIRRRYQPPLGEAPEAGGSIESYYNSLEKTLEIQD